VNSETQPAPLKFQPLDHVSAISFASYASTATVTPITLVLLARELTFSLAAGGAIEAMRASLLLLTLLVSGWVAAHWGKAFSLGWSSILSGVGLLVYSFAPAYSVVVLAAALMGLGSGIVEALLNPLVQDLHPDDSGRYMNTLNAFFSVGVFITVLGGGELLSQGFSWRIIMVLLGIVSIGTGILFLALNSSAPHVTTDDSAAVLRHKIAILRNPRFPIFALMMFFGGGVEGGLTFWSASYIQLHFEQLPRLGGVGTAAFAGGMIVGRLASGRFVPQHRLPHLIIGSASLGIVVGILAPLMTGLLWLIGVLFLAGLSVACFWPSIQSYSTDRIEGDSTSLFILLSCGGIPGFGFTAWLMGLIGEARGINASLYVIPVFMAALAALAVFERNYEPRNSSSTSHR
jgi:fucose permease